MPVSAWVARHAHRFPQGGRVLDLACGRGRHARHLAAAGCRVLAVDRDGEALAGLAGVAGIETRCLDLEGEAWPLASERFDGVLVTHYLHRPRLAATLDLLAPGGVLIYETFMAGHERFGRPSRPDFLLRPGELLEAARRAGLFVVAFEQGEVPGVARLQRLCACRSETGDAVLL